MSDAPSFQAVALRCGKCKNEWTGHITIRCSFNLAVASMRDIVDRGCPVCGWHGVIMDVGKRPAPAAQTAGMPNV